MTGSDPDRDRKNARRQRYGFRDAEPVADSMSSFLDSPEAQRMRRFQKVAPALREALSPSLLTKVTPVRMQSGILTLEVSDGMALHELRQHASHTLLEALAAHGTGISRLQWRLAKSVR
ncbi:MAG: DUF721 domain-containing protein [Planctomycetes bacterium]|nr:DUF721 domain-containing protein [Planctomycetota bacterium]